ncbi:momilactone A synthase [Selaginella moellendorffii]|uniref:momilactone A synthase n=1 Tax=Selaginella moellendorffii TaxID=88036 RepID=UPI000D1C5DF3|nr:momilactone A synthase [Selaginella moellendorffii]|eukprot:XP_024519205.1 momilactone A synthase [Selaginella moellendorffii]
MKLQDKVAIVTGGASGIGEAIAIKFAAHGAFVIVGDIQDELGQKVCAAIGPRATFVHCDVADEASVEALVNTAVARHGRLDIMMNNAGVGEPGGRDVRDLDIRAFDRVMSVNVAGVALGMKHAARHMVPRGSGVIINTASNVTGAAGIAPLAYTASKHAVVGLTRTAAVQLGRYGIRANAISPGAIPTPAFVRYFREAVPGMDENGARAVASKATTLRYGEDLESALSVEDVANAAVFLASEDSRFVSGHELMLDGASTVTDKSFDAIGMMLATASS